MANVDLSKYKEFADKKFLVVDDFPEFRTAIKRMVEAFGGTDIDTASNGEDAIRNIKNKKYDVVLCDYNLGENKDGQQVLEEAKMMKTIQPSQVFLLLTAENTAEMVMGALEYEPDGYLVKPFNKDMVYNRLTKVIKRKKELMQVFLEIEAGNLEKAIELCNEKISAGGKYAAACLKAKGRLLLDLKKYDEAFELYKSLADAKCAPWMLMGMGKAKFYQEQYEEALKHFQGIIDISNVNVEGYDWIAKSLIKLGQPQQAQSTLEHAINLSSKAILRQQALGDLAYDNQDFEVAEKSYKAAVYLGKNSCYRRALDYVRYALLLLDKIPEESNDRNKVRAANEALTTLEQLSLAYREDSKLVTTSQILQILAYVHTARTDKAANLAKEVQKEIDKTADLDFDPEIWTKFGEGLIALGDDEKGQNIINQHRKLAL